MRNNKYFKPILIDRNDDDFINNTFPMYISFIITLIAVILDQYEWNLITIAATAVLSYLIYRIGYKIGNNLSNK